MRYRLAVCRDLLSSDGVLIVAIDRYEQPRLTLLLEEMFPNHNIDCIVVVHNPRGTQGANFSYTHEFAIFVTPKGKKVIGTRSVPEDEIQWRSLMKHGNVSTRGTSRKCFYPIKVINGEIVGFGDLCDPDFHPEGQTEIHDGVTYVYPIDTNGVERKWCYARNTVEGVKHLLKTRYDESGYVDILLGKDYKAYKTVWQDPKFDANFHGSQLLKKLVPGSAFSYPKSLYTVVECIEAVVKDDPDALVMDLFAGSGTTGHAVMEINKRYGGDRRFILVEREDYAETVTLQRNLRVMELLDVRTPLSYYDSIGKVT